MYNTARQNKNVIVMLIVTIFCFVAFLSAGNFAFAANSSNVTKIGTTEYATIQEAINMAENGDTITVINDIVVENTITVPAGKTVTIDLNGKIISQTKEQTDKYQMILNDGNLTIKDSVGTGKISYKDSRELTGYVNYISDTIYNCGNLTINGGTIENLSIAAVAEYGYPHAVDTYSGSRNTSVTINGGTIYCAEYSAVRMFCVSATYTADLIIKGGTIKGAIDMQNGSSAPANGSLTINGGTFETTANVNNIRFANWNSGATTYGITAAIYAGSFDGNISTQYVPSSSTFDKKIIYGGTFDVDMPDQYLADGIVMDNKGNAVTFDDAKANAIDEVDQYFADLVAQYSYNNESKNLLDELYSTATAAINNATSVEEIDSAIEAYKTDADQVEYIPIDTLRSQAIAKLDAQADKILSGVYSAENRAKIERMVKSSKSSIRNATVKTDMDNIIADFVNRASKVEPVNEWIVCAIVCGTCICIVALISLFCLLYQKKKSRSTDASITPVDTVITDTQADKIELSAEVAEGSAEGAKDAVEEKTEVAEETEISVKSEEPVEIVEDVAQEVVATEVHKEQPVEEKRSFADMPKIASKTFEEKLAECDEELSANYNVLKEALCSYKKLKGRVSKKCESYRKGRVLIAKLAIVGKSVRLYLALDPSEYATSKYHHRDVSDKKAHSATPMMLRIRSKRSVKYAIQLIEEVANKNGLAK